MGKVNRKFSLRQYLIAIFSTLIFAKIFIISKIERIVELVQEEKRIIKDLEEQKQYNITNNEIKDEIKNLKREIRELCCEEAETLLSKIVTKAQEIDISFREGDIEDVEQNKSKDKEDKILTKKRVTFEIKSPSFHKIVFLMDEISHYQGIIHPVKLEMNYNPPSTIKMRSSFDVGTPSLSQQPHEKVSDSQ